MGLREAWNALRTPGANQAVDEVAATEAAGVPGAVRIQPGFATAAAGQRIGFDSDVPPGGANKLNPGGDYPDGRASFLQSLYTSYVGCPWLSAPIDAIARTITAGGVTINPTADADDTEAAEPTEPPPAVLALQNLIDFCNPEQDIIQLLRGVATDLGIYGDAFVEVVWLFGLPVAIYSLDPATVTIDADEHGTVFGYDQVIDSRSAHFEPHEVIHIPMDSPKGSLYGMGIAQKVLLPVTIWLFAAATIKETMKKGDPPHLHFDFPLEVQPDEVRSWRGQYNVKNLGTANIGNPITTRGGVKPNEFKVGALNDYLKIQDSCRDTILSDSGVPPSKVGVIESGNIGGGTGTSQDKTFRVNTCGPVAAIILEKLNFSITKEAFGIEGYALAFKDLDWRDDAAVEDIRDKRLRNGIWTLNEARADIDLPPVGDEGDAHAIMSGKEILTWTDLEDYSRATVDSIKSKTTAADAAAKQAEKPPAPIIAGHPGMPGAPGEPPPGAPPGATPPTPPAGDAEPPAPGKKKPEESAPTWRDAVKEHYRRLTERQEV